MYNYFIITKYLFIILQITSEMAAACESDALTANKKPSSATEFVHFDVDAIIEGFKACLKEDTLITDGYIRGYTEMTK